MKFLFRRHDGPHRDSPHDRTGLRRDAVSPFDARINALKPLVTTIYTL